jgi:putative cell wall-binding protein/spore germination protein YaaH
MKRVLKYVAVFLAFLVLISVPPVALAGDFTVTRLSGADRYSTAVAISQYDRQYSGYVVLARGDNYADALAGVPLAARYDAPVLLTQRDVLTPATRAEIEALSPHTVIVLGGPAAVSQAVEDELSSMGLVVDRVSGENRFDTAAQIALRVAPHGVGTAIVAGGMDFPDALASASYAGSLGYPVLLTLKDELPAETEQALSDLDVYDTILVGGVSVVSDLVKDQLPDPIRIGGSNRFETSVLVAKHFGLSSSGVFIATGMGFADAITGAALAARLNSGLLLVERKLPESVSNFLSRENVSSVIILGGETAVSTEIETELQRKIGLVGKQVEVTTASLMTAAAGAGQVLRYPYAGHVTKVLDVSGQYVKIEFGSKTGWIHRDNVSVTNKDVDDIRLGWQFTTPSNSSFLQQSPADSGYNVYAPVMFYVDNSGLRMYPARNFTANIKLAREQGYQVWLTIAQFGTSPNLRDESIPWIINKALELDVDGINIDYEGMGSANRDAFSAFMGKLYTETRKHNLTLSVDVNRHSATVYGASYDRAALGQVSDYVILMAYDEHWSSSPQEGSVASHPWTRRSLELLLEEVPAEKVILGMPFYTRNWEIRDVTVLEEDSVVITGDAVRIRTEPTTVGGSETTIFLGHKDRVFRYVDEVEGENIEGVSVWYQVEFEEGQYGYITGRWSKYYPAGSYLGAKEVNSMSLGQKAAGQIVDNYDPDAKTSGWISSSTGNWIPMYDVSIDYDPESGQDVVTWTCQYNYLNKIWLENPMSLHKRAMLAEEFELAGLAAWSLDWMDAEAQLWNLLR